MANEEERAAIMAEYYANVARGGNGGDDDEDEGEFNPSSSSSSSSEEDDGDSSNDDDGDSSNDDDEQKAKQDDSAIAVLSGTVSLNDEGRIVYSGRWAMKNKMKTVSSSAASSSPPNGIGNVEEKDNSDGAKFKLKSKKLFVPASTSSGGGGKKNVFNLANPLEGGSGVSGSEGDATSRTLLFDGFFVTATEDKNGGQPSSRKIKERDVEVIFSQKGASTSTSNQQNNATFNVNGRGSNEYGIFTFHGRYIVVDDDMDHNIDVENKKINYSVPLICEKQYSVAKAARESEDDDEISDAEEDRGASIEELAELHEEACMPVDDLRKRYSAERRERDGGCDVNDNGDRKVHATYRENPTKKSKKQDNDSDEEYGF